MLEGRIESGVIKKNGSYIMMPNRDEISVSALYGEAEEELEGNARAGDQVRLRIRGLEEEDILPGKSPILISQFPVPSPHFQSPFPRPHFQSPFPRPYFPPHFPFHHPLTGKIRLRTLQSQAPRSLRDAIRSTDRAP